MEGGKKVICNSEVLYASKPLNCGCKCQLCLSVLAVVLVQLVAVIQGKAPV